MAFRTVCLQEDDGGSERWIVCGGSTPLPGGRRAAVACTLAAATPVELGLRPARWKGDQTQPVSAAHRDPVKEVPPASGTCCPHVEALVLHHEARGQHKEQPQSAPKRCALRKWQSPLANRLRAGQRPPEEKAPKKSTQKKHPKKSTQKAPALPPPPGSPAGRQCPQSRFEASRCRTGTQSTPASCKAYHA